MTIATIKGRVAAATPGPCPGCGVPVFPKRITQRFCSDRCRRNQRERTVGREARNARGARYRQTEAGASKSAAATRRRYATNPDKALARAMVGHAVRDGRLTRPDQCSRCANPGRIEAHHPNGYSRDHWLDVTWLCKACHVATHAEVGA